MVQKFFAYILLKPAVELILAYPYISVVLNVGGMVCIEVPNVFF